MKREENAMDDDTPHATPGPPPQEPVPSDAAPSEPAPSEPAPSEPAVAEAAPSGAAAQDAVRTDAHDAREAQSAWDARGAEGARDAQGAADARDAGGEGDTQGGPDSAPLVWGADWRPPKPPRRRTYDPLAVALGNASLLGVGYFFLGHRLLALWQLAGTLTLAVVVWGHAETWCELAVLGWWLLTSAHGWYLARRGEPRTTARGHRLAAAALTLAVLLTAGLLRWDAAGIQDEVTSARERGDCDAVLAAQDGVGFWQRLADAPGAERGDGVVEVCRRLLGARDELNRGLQGESDPRKLTNGFNVLSDVLKEPEYTQAVTVVLDGFLRWLPLNEPCRTVRVTDWLRARKTRHDVLDRVAGTVRRTAPQALVDCADTLHGSEDWDHARDRYQQLLDRYPTSPLADRAREGAHRATLAGELATVRDRLSDAYGGQPAYCSNPAKYSAAPAARKGAVNRALFYGNDEYTDQLPKGWRASEASKAALIVCADDTAATDAGAATATCPYRDEDSPYLSGDVTFHKIAVPVKVYALRTGEVVAERTVEIGGTSCPASFRHSRGIGGPPSDWLVSESPADVRTAFEPLVNLE
ncbi:tetratricopeptide repeat protein [Streptomyces sp. 796.1]|uniref:tetratricopeptide repeat protein n=1 Tax=Streptomyces sp. 796.1 TaxID=3163029 RepID=UPI0039C9D295